MKRGILVLAVLMIITITGGVLTSGLFPGVPTIIQSVDPNANVFEATPEQANLIIFWTLFVLGNLVVIGLVLAVLFWRGNVEVERAHLMETPQRDSDSLPETASE